MARGASAWGLPAVCYSSAPALGIAFCVMPAQKDRCANLVRFELAGQKKMNCVTLDVCKIQFNELMRLLSRVFKRERVTLVELRGQKDTKA